MLGRGNRSAEAWAVGKMAGPECSGLTTTLHCFLTQGSFLLFQTQLLILFFYIHSPLAISMILALNAPSPSYIIPLSPWWLHCLAVCAYISSTQACAELLEEKDACFSVNIVMSSREQGQSWGQGGQDGQDSQDSQDHQCSHLGWASQAQRSSNQIWPLLVTHRVWPHSCVKVQDI